MNDVFVFGWLVVELITAVPGNPNLQGDVAAIGQRFATLALCLTKIRQTKYIVIVDKVYSLP